MVTKYYFFPLTGFEPVELELNKSKNTVVISINGSKSKFQLSELTKELTVFLDRLKK